MALLDGRVAFVTGAGSGIGRAAALAFAAEGAKLAVADIALDSVEETARMCAAIGVESFAIGLDVTDEAAVDAAVDAAAARWGRLDIGFNNAGVSLEDTRSPWGTLDLVDRSFAVNVRGVLLCMNAELRHMSAAGRGAIVNTASVAGMAGLGGPGYCGSKHAVIGLTRSAAMRYATEGIRVNAVCPGVIETGMTDAVAKDPRAAEIMAKMQPIGRIGQASEVADAVVFLCSDKASFITGHPLAVDGGFLAR